MGAVYSTGAVGFHYRAHAGAAVIDELDSFVIRTAMVDRDPTNQ